MNPRIASKQLVTLVLIASTSLLSGCGMLVSKAASSFGENLNSAIMNQDDPEVVEAAMPTYIVLLDSFLQDDKKNPAVLSAGGAMYAAYGALFADGDGRASKLTTRGRNYGREAICLTYDQSCDWSSMTHDEFVASLQGVKPKQADYLYTYGFTSLAYLQAHTSDWNALAELPQAEAVMRRYIELAGAEADPAAYNYLAILLTLRPPSLGGKPEEARGYWERAIDLTGGCDLGIKVAMAEGYAKLLFEKELHDRLVGEVLNTTPYCDGKTLLNVLAQERALELQAESCDYFGEC